MTEAGDYEPSSWAKSHDFGAARRSYANKAKAKASKAKSSKAMARDSYLEKTVETASERSLVVCCDVTRSMGSWPRIIFSKLPFLEYEAKIYMGDDVEICFAGVGDAFSDSYPMQVRPFSRGEDLPKRMEELIIERGGGGSGEESYELAAAYFAYNCEMPNAVDPIMIFIGDERIYDRLFKRTAKKHAQVDLPKVQTKEQLFDSLKQKFDVYLVQKITEVRGNELTKRDKRVYDCWEPLVGADHIVFLPSPERVVDVIFGILGEATGKRDYFVEELEHRQLADEGGREKVDRVLSAMKTIHVDR